MRERIFSCFEEGSWAIIVPGFIVHPFQSMVLSNSSFFHESGAPMMRSKMIANVNCTAEVDLGKRRKKSST